MIKTAHISPCQRYRYLLSREWDSSLPTVGFVGLNPSTADATLDDPTIRRCIGFAQSWGYGALHMVNLFAFRATKPEVMLHVPDPVGPDNDRWLLEVTHSCALVVAAWGNKGGHGGRDAQVRRLLPALSVIQLTRAGKPQHPLYLPGHLRPKPWVAGHG